MKEKKKLCGVFIIASVLLLDIGCLLARKLPAEKAPAGILLMGISLAGVYILLFLFFRGNRNSFLFWGLLFFGVAGFSLGMWFF